MLATPTPTLLSAPQRLARENEQLRAQIERLKQALAEADERTAAAESQKNNALRQLHVCNELSAREALAVARAACLEAIVPLARKLQNFLRDADAVEGQRRSRAESICDALDNQGHPYPSMAFANARTAFDIALQHLATIEKFQREAQTE